MQFLILLGLRMQYQMNDANKKKQLRRAKYFIARELVGIIVLSEVFL